VTQGQRRFEIEFSVAGREYVRDPLRIRIEARVGVGISGG
jgi:hypothetical protein